MLLETERLILRPVQEADARAVSAILRDPDVTHNLLLTARSKEEALLWVERCREAMEQQQSYTMAIVLKGTGDLVGVTALVRISWDHLSTELVYWLGKRYWGKGYMTEAARRMVQFGFEELGLERISAGCFTRNAASKHVLEKIGMRYEGVGRHEYRKGDEFLDAHHFAIIRKDYHETGNGG